MLRRLERGRRSSEIPILDIDHVTIGPYIRNTLALDRNARPRGGAARHLPRAASGRAADARHRRGAVRRPVLRLRALRPVAGRPRQDEHAARASKTDDTLRVLRNEDIVAVVRMLVEIKDGRGEIDDIDHLGNRRVRSVGELMENQFRVGLLRMERAIRERMSSVEIDAAMPHDLINAKPVAAAVREFFGSSQLSQFMDQTNPLSEITHKRRLSALGPGRPDPRARRLRGARRAPDALRPHLPDRDAGRPEHRPDQQPRHLRADQQVRLHREPVPPGRRRQGQRRGRLSLGHGGGALHDRPGQLRARTPTAASRASWSPAARTASSCWSRPDTIDFIDVSPKQLVSVAAALIPFLENDDANRALMGSNMQRQAVPLLQADAPFVGTGMEDVVARDSGAAIARQALGRRRPGRRLAHRRPRDRRHRPGRQRASTSTGCGSSSARTRTPASTSVRW